MSWAVYTTDAKTGLLEDQIDIPNISWSVDVNDSGLSSTPARKVGQDSVQNVTIPWNAIPGNSQQARYDMLMPGAKGLALFWQTTTDIATGRIGTPVVWGVITNRTDAWDSTSVSVSSVYSLLANRYVVRPDFYKDGTSTDTLTFSGMTMRGIASEVGWLCTNAKQGGELPVDWTYRGEKHVRRGSENANTHTRSYTAWDIANLSGQKVLDDLETDLAGVDMQWRPYLTNDGYYVREKFVAGTDENRYLGQNMTHGLAVFRGGGNFENMTVSYMQPVTRVYATGSGSDKTTMTAKAENLAMTGGQTGLILMETYMADSDAKDVKTLKGFASAELSAQDIPLMQVKGEIHFDDPQTPAPGSIWPGEVVDVNVQDHPALPDGSYRMRLMQMTGDASDKATLTFDTMAVPAFTSTAKPIQTIPTPPQPVVIPPASTVVKPTSVKIGSLHKPSKITIGFDDLTLDIRPQQVKLSLPTVSSVEITPPQQG